MKTTACDCQQIINAKPKDGVYSGHWSGYIVVFHDERGNEFRASTETGIRTTNAPCEVTVEGQFIMVEETSR